MSRGNGWPSFCMGRIQPSLRQMRQQWVSTGKTFRPSEYIITHRATFLPTSGREVRNFLALLVGPALEGKER
jgi:hypothetical protein